MGEVRIWHFKTGSNSSFHSYTPGYCLWVTSHEYHYLIPRTTVTYWLEDGLR